MLYILSVYYTIIYFLKCVHFTQWEHRKKYLSKNKMQKLKWAVSRLFEELEMFWRHFWAYEKCVFLCLFSGWEARGLKVPHNRGEMRRLFMSFAFKLREQIKADLKLRVERGERFSLSVDEWTSYRNRRYFAVELHVKDKVKYNLGLKAINGSFPADKAAKR